MWLLLLLPSFTGFGNYCPQAGLVSRAQEPGTTCGQRPPTQSFLLESPLLGTRPGRQGRKGVATWLARREKLPWALPASSPAQAAPACTAGPRAARRGTLICGSARGHLTHVPGAEPAPSQTAHPPASSEAPAAETQPRAGPQGLPRAAHLRAEQRREPQDLPQPPGVCRPAVHTARVPGPVPGSTRTLRCSHS